MSPIDRTRFTERLQSLIGVIDDHYENLPVHKAVKLDAWLEEGYKLVCRRKPKAAQ